MARRGDPSRACKHAAMSPAYGHLQVAASLRCTGLHQARTFQHALLKHVGSAPEQGRSAPAAAARCRRLRSAARPAPAARPPPPPRAPAPAPPAPPAPARARVPRSLGPPTHTTTPVQPPRAGNGARCRVVPRPRVARPLGARSRHALPAPPACATRGAPGRRGDRRRTSGHGIACRERRPSGPATFGFGTLPVGPLRSPA